jgi:hypothetical protein
VNGYTGAMKIDTFANLQQSLRQHRAALGHYFDCYHRYLLALIAVAFVLWALQLSHRPISEQQQQQFTHYLHQSAYPLSQSYALQLQRKVEPISQYHYFRLLRMLHAEQQRMHYQVDEQPAPVKNIKSAGR